MVHIRQLMTPALRKLAEELPEDVTVIFKGHVDDVTAEYAEADAFVLPSVSEGMSNSLLEAMAQGMVCLASDISENRAVLRHGENGLLFRQGSAQILASHVVELIEDQSTDGGRMAALRVGARVRVEEAFSPERVASELRSLYGEVLDATHERGC